MSKIPRLLVVLVAAATFVLALTAPTGSGEPNPCPGNYSVRATSTDTSLDAFDVNRNGIVCVFNGLSKSFDPVRDDRVSNKK